MRIGLFFVTRLGVNEMNNEKISIDLTGVPQTLLLPLLGRALFSQESYSPLHDERAVS